MVEDDTFTYHVKQQSADQVNKAAQSLITKERTQKLDLLIHLLANLKQGLVVCGPQGIGKTTLLNILQERKTESWRYCPIQGHADISFEAIQQQLFRAQSSQPAQHVVLIIDNAGQLVPGLIATLIQYAAANPVLRVIFALTHDELQVKRSSDRIIDDCHIVEIPALSERQCGDFLQHLSTKPYANLAFKTIDDGMIAHVYRETHGIPGRIIAEISGLSAGTKQGGKLKWLIILAVAAAAAIALAALWLMSSKQDDKKITVPVAVEQKTDNTGVAPAQPESPIMLTLPPVQPITRQQPAPANDGEKTIVSPDGANVNKNEQQQSVVPTAKPEAASPAVDKQANEPPRSGISVPAPPQASVINTPPPEPVSREEGNAGKLPVAAIQPSTSSMMPAGEQEKPAQAELNRAASEARTPVTQNIEIKAQPEPMNKATEQKPGKKQTDAAQQKSAEQLWASQEKLKQAELKKPVISVEPIASINKLETIQIPQKPVNVVAVPEQGITETAPMPAQQSMEIALPKAVTEISSIPSPESNFTLQLMVLSKQSSTDDMLRKYPAMAPDIRVIRSVAKGKEKFILEYGSYPDAVSANKAKESLPFEFHRAMVRKIAR
ncbi:MAG: hypothetical protein ACXWE9_02210 [Methylobacter sp.]